MNTEEDKKEEEGGVRHVFDETGDCGGCGFNRDRCEPVQVRTVLHRHSPPSEGHTGEKQTVIQTSGGYCSCTHPNVDDPNCPIHSASRSNPEAVDSEVNQETGIPHQRVERIAEVWAANDGLWNTQEVVETNLIRFAQVLLHEDYNWRVQGSGTGTVAAPSDLGTPKQEIDRIERVSKDTARLDWVDKNGINLHHPNHSTIKIPVGHNQGSLRLSVRQIIDAARGVAPEPVGEPKSVESGLQPKAESSASAREAALVEKKEGLPDGTTQMPRGQSHQESGEVSNALKMRYFDVIYFFGLERTELDPSVLTIPLHLKGHGKSTATGSTVSQVCACALEWLEERDPDWFSAARREPLIPVATTQNVDSGLEAKPDSSALVEALEKKEEGLSERNADST